MNKRLVLRLLGVILVIEALAMVPATLLALLYGDGDFWRCSRASRCRWSSACLCGG